ncbi:hypothetical protein FB45DRAFT_880155 [Roridomyces roridus]|uniref:Uncharacterized protein n=1 Tax=Roridomyces roridus TaxID=1738132 RepID=A0AAD7F8D3_9AGAR|nr:hypothetical protein FB45DRAFT_880155 [Roridomyces roridus]
MPPRARPIEDSSDSGKEDPVESAAPKSSRKTRRSGQAPVTGPASGATKATKSAKKTSTAGSRTQAALSSLTDKDALRLAAHITRHKAKVHTLQLAIQAEKTKQAALARDLEAIRAIKAKPKTSDTIIPESLAVPIDTEMTFARSPVPPSPPPAPPSPAPDPPATPAPAAPPPPPVLQPISPAALPSRLVSSFSADSKVIPPTVMPTSPPKLAALHPISPKAAPSRTIFSPRVIATLPPHLAAPQPSSPAAVPSRTVSSFSADRKTIAVSSLGSPRTFLAAPARIPSSTVQHRKSPKSTNRQSSSNHTPIIQTTPTSAKRSRAPSSPSKSSTSSHRPAPPTKRPRDQVVSRPVVALLTSPGSGPRPFSFEAARRRLVQEGRIDADQRSLHRQPVPPVGHRLLQNGGYDPHAARPQPPDRMVHSLGSAPQHAARTQPHASSLWSTDRNMPRQPSRPPTLSSYQQQQQHPSFMDYVIPQSHTSSFASPIQYHRQHPSFTDHVTPQSHASSNIQYHQQQHPSFTDHGYPQSHASGSALPPQGFRAEPHYHRATAPPTVPYTTRPDFNLTRHSYYE